MDSEAEDCDVATAATIILLDSGFEIEDIDWDSVSKWRRYLNESIDPQT